MTLWKIFSEPLFKKNPVLFMLLGLCPVLAVTTSVENGLGMGFATLFVLVGSSTLISLLRKVISDRIRIPAFITIIATMVTLASFLLEAYAYPLYESLGIYIPLIVVNCIVLGRALSFAYKNSVVPSILDAIGTGFGFIIALFVISFIRELLGIGMISAFGLTLNFHIPAFFIFVLPPGALLVMGLILAIRNYLWSES
jgi:Na+-translocating ferredoxin:NAD+ oxidoreductase subunit E